MSRIITVASLQGLSVEQLRGLHHKVQQELVQSEPGSPQRREALAKLELISQAIACAYISRPGF